MPRISPRTRLNSLNNDQGKVVRVTLGTGKLTGILDDHLYQFRRGTIPALEQGVFQPFRPIYQPIRIGHFHHAVSIQDQDVAMGYQQRFCLVIYLLMIPKRVHACRGLHAAVE